MLDSGEIAADGALAATEGVAATGGAAVRAHAVESALRRVDAFARAPSLAARLDAFVELVAFVRASAPELEPLPSEWDGAPLAPAQRRLAVVLGCLERSPEALASLQAALRATFDELRALALFAEAGLPNDRGLLLELADRISRRLLPKPRADHELASLVTRMFADEDALEWLAALPCALFDRALALCARDTCWKRLRDDLEEALCLLATRIAGRGLAEELRARRNAEGVRASPYHRLVQATDAWLRLLDLGQDARFDPPIESEELRAAGLEWTTLAAACRSGNDEVRAHLATSGVSVAVVYDLELIDGSLERMELLFHVLAIAPRDVRASAIQRLCVALVRARLDDRSLRALLRENTELLARKVIERTGHTGEHYITTTRREWFGMLGSAAGGGLITTWTAIAKCVIAQAHLPVLVDFALLGSNYATSFIAIQLCGFTLATKQPAMTAAALAALFERPAGAARSEALATHVARIARSQLAAALSNVLMVSAGAVLFEWLWSRWRGHAFLSPETADYVLRSLDPTASGTIWYAILTGVLLWMSGLAAGWVGNWVVYRRLPQALAEHRLGERIGPHWMQRFSRAFAAHVAGFGGSIALGFLLGGATALGHATGLPIDVRHVTLSTGQLALAAASLGEAALHDPRVHAACVGIAVVFVLNLTTSFVLALLVAARAREARWSDLRDLASALAQRLVRRPLEFVFPPRAATE